MRLHRAAATSIQVKESMARKTADRIAVQGLRSVANTHLVVPLNRVGHVQQEIAGKAINR